MNKYFLKISLVLIGLLAGQFANAACNNPNIPNPNSGCLDECRLDEVNGANGECDAIADALETRVATNLDAFDEKYAKLCLNQYFVDGWEFCKGSSSNNGVAYYCDNTDSAWAPCNDLCDNTWFLTGQGGGYNFCDDFCSNDPKPSYCSSTGTSGTTNGDLSLSDQPLFLGDYADPNLVITITDTDSMMEEVLPKNGANYVYPPVSDVYGSTIITADVHEFDANNINSVKARSSSVNSLYYDPSVEYVPWVGAGGDPLIQNQAYDASGNVTTVDLDKVMSFDGDGNVEAINGVYCAPYNPTDLSKGCLELNKVQKASSTSWVGEGAINYYYPAVYYVFDENNQFSGTDCDSANVSHFDQVACYTEYVIAPDNTDFSDECHDSSDNDFDSIYSLVCPENGVAELTDAGDSNYDYLQTRNENIEYPDYVFPSPSRLYANEMQNFANWFTYYRSKLLTMRAATGFALQEVPDSYRVALAQVGKTSASLVIDEDQDSTFDSADDYQSDVMTSGVETYSAIGGDIYSALYADMNGGSSRNLLKAFDEVGGYFAFAYTPKGPWGNFPPDGLDEESNPDTATTVADAEYCRRSYNLTIADGVYQDAPPFPSSGSSLSDIADKFFAPGLSSGNAGLQPGIGADIAGVTFPEMGKIDVNYDGSYDDHGDNAAIFTHLTQLTIGFGVEASITVPDIGGAIASSPTMPVTSNTVNDLYYAAISSGGRYYEVAKYDELYQAIVSQIQAVGANQGYLDATSSGAAVALNSGSLFNGSVLFQALFNASDWSGTVKAYSIDQFTGALSASPVEQTFPNSRFIASYGCTSSGCDGIVFAESALEGAYLTTNSTADTNSLMYQIEDTDADRADAIDWFEGDAVTGLRSRSELLGDIIHSAPVYVGQPNGPYFTWSDSDDESGSSYQDFINEQCIVGENGCYRKEVVLIGANDGFLHFFEVDVTGGADDSLEEVAAYMPKALFEEGNLSGLKETSYETDHKYFVDSTPTVGDAFINPGGGSKSWRTVVVGGLGAGGKGIYALDITAKTEDNGDYIFDSASELASSVLWEYTATTPIDANGDHSNIPDDYLGYTFSRPNIVRLPNGDWGVIFGNGYNSANADGDACLYTLDLSSGALLNRTCVDGISDAPEDGTGAVLLTDSNGNTKKNGMSTVTPVDIDGDYVVDYVYGGDLYGNLWKFEFSGNTSNGNLDVSLANSQGSSINPLFKAGIFDLTSNTSTLPYIQVQPITTRPSVIRHPSSYGGYLVMFGTGKYMESSDSVFDNPTNEIQSFYAIWDRDEGGVTEFDRTALLQQDILFDVSITNNSNETFDFRITTDNGYPNMPWHFDAGSVPDNGITATKVTANVATNGYTYDHLDLVSPCLLGTATSSQDCEYLGWYIDLFKTYNNNTNDFTNVYTLGERQVTDAVVRNGRVIFTTTVPDNSVCGAGDYGWLMELDAESGSRLPFTPFDINGDGSFTTADYAAYLENRQEILDGSTGIPVSGRKSTVGLLPTPGILSDYSDASSGKEFKYMSGSSGEIEAISENPGSSSDESFRQSWRELRLDDMINFNNL